MRKRFLAWTLLLPLLAAPPPNARKVEQIGERLEKARQSAERGKRVPVRFTVTDREMNDYLAYSLQTEPRPVVESIRLHFEPQNFATATVGLDLDDIERSNPGTLPPVLRMVVKGKRVFQIQLQFTAINSELSFVVKRATVDGVPVPPRVVERIIAIAAARQPEKYDTTRPMPLPYGLKTVWTGPATLSGSN